jgi:hypothetical protein
LAMLGSAPAVRYGGVPTSGEEAFATSKTIGLTSLLEWKLVVLGPSSRLFARKTKKGLRSNLTTDLPPELVR